MDRHALLSAGAYPSSSRSPPGPATYRTSSPFEQPYTNGGSPYTSDPYAEYGNQQGAPKKEPGDQPPGFFGRVAAYASQRTAEDLEEQNDERLEGLSARVKMLKDVSLTHATALSSHSSTKD